MTSKAIKSKVHELEKTVDSAMLALNSVAEALDMSLGAVICNALQSFTGCDKVFLFARNKEKGESIQSGLLPEGVKIIMECKDAI